MNKTIRPEEFEAAMQQIFKEYGDEAYDIIDRTFNEVGKEGVQMVKRLSPVGHRRTGKYKDTWAHTRVNGRLFVREHIHQKSTKKFQNWRLVHLLEKGHLARDGSWVKPVKPHVTPTQEWVDQEIMRKLKLRLGE